MKIAITGEAGAGKDEVGKILREKYKFKHVRFADPLKNMLRTYYKEIGLSPEQIESRIEGQMKECLDEHLCGKTPRWAMQTLGTQWGRDLIGEDFWVNAFMMKHKYSAFDMVNLDCRFENEAIAAKAAGFVIVKKHGGSALLGEKESQHESERGISPELIDFEIPWLDRKDKLTDHVGDLLWKIQVTEVM